MATVVDIINRALQAIGTRTSVNTTELANETSNEAIQANLSVTNLRQGLLRMAPWNCATKTKNLAYITSSPGTPDNTSPATTTWLPGQPTPPWSYEYQYPVDCLRPCFVIPQTQTGSVSGVPITTAVTGGAPSFWQGPPVAYKVATDEFYPVTAGAVVAGGTGFAVDDEIQLPFAAAGAEPIGAPVLLRVATLAGSAIATAAVVNQIAGEASARGGSYFKPQTGTIAQYKVFRYGREITTATGATFTLTFGTRDTQRVILTNQEDAVLTYIKDIDNVNVMDTLFQSAWSSLIGATLAMSLTGDKSLANSLVVKANLAIEAARTADGNEGLTINDVTPEWLRIRGIDYPGWGMTGPGGFDWGGLWPQW